MNNFPCMGAIFDLDGVITQTAKLHFEAWKSTFDEFLKARSDVKGAEFRSFTRDDYLQFVDNCHQKWMLETYQGCNFLTIVMHHN